VTNDHVCNASTGGYVRIQDDSGNEYIKKVLKRNFMRDLCLIEGISAPPLAIASKQPVRFDRLRVVGHPLLQPTSRSEGEFVKNIIIPLGLPALADGTCKEGATPVESFFGTFCIVNMEVGYTTVLIWGGNSGSPIVNKDGEVVGVINSADNRTNQGNFIPLPYLKEMLAD
jgi:S1-C subfamily serine protease